MVIPIKVDPHYGKQCPYCKTFFICDDEDLTITDTVNFEGDPVTYKWLKCPRCKRRLVIDSKENG